MVISHSYVSLPEGTVDGPAKSCTSWWFILGFQPSFYILLVGFLPSTVVQHSTTVFLVHQSWTCWWLFNIVDVPNGKSTTWGIDWGNCSYIFWRFLAQIFFWQCPPSQGFVSPCLQLSPHTSRGLVSPCLHLSPLVSPHVCLRWMVCPPSRGLVSPCLPLSPHMCACIGCCVCLPKVLSPLVSHCGYAFTSLKFKLNI